MAIVWLASKLVIAFLIAKAFGQCPQENIVIGPGPGNRTFSGKVEVGGEGDAQYVLLDNNPESGITGIHFLAGCKDNEGQEGREMVLRLKNGTLALAFVLEQYPGRLPDSKILQLRPNVSYADLLALPQSFDIIVEVK